MAVTHGSELFPFQRSLCRGMADQPNHVSVPSRGGTAPPTMRSVPIQYRRVLDMLYAVAGIHPLLTDVGGFFQL